MKDLISVIIPAFNQGHFLAEAVNSALTQTYEEVEVIIVDDGSTDNTAQIAQSFSDKRVHYVFKENGGLSSARNEGIRHANGDFLSFLDSDDCFLPEKLELLLTEMENDPELGLVAGQAIPVDEQGNPVGKLFDSPLPEDPKQLLLGNPLHVGSILLRRIWQERVGFFDETLRSYEDWDLWLRLALAGCKMKYVPIAVSLYRFHTAQMTRDGRQMTTATFSVLDKLFSKEGISNDWMALRDDAYSRAYLRAAAQSYRIMAYEDAKENLAKAISLSPGLMDENGCQMANRFIAWTNLPKFPDPLVYLEDIYNNLPHELETLENRRPQELSRAALQLAFDAYDQGDMVKTRKALRRAIRYQPGRLADRGTLSILIRSHLP